MKEGDTALHVAASQCHMPVVKLLVKKGASLDVKNQVMCNVYVIVWLGDFNIYQIYKKSYSLQGDIIGVYVQ